jgi:uncharacterized membrane protein
MKRILILVVLAALAAIPAASAAKPAHAGGTSLSISPTNPVVGDTLFVSGCGFIPDVSFVVVLTTPVWEGGLLALVGADGCFTTLDGYTLTVAGDYSVYADQHSRSKTLRFTVG